LVLCIGDGNGEHYTATSIYSYGGGQSGEGEVMRVINPRCRIAWFLEAKRDGKFKYEYIPPIRRCTKAIHSMYWRAK
jgi:hypothetical protein